MTDLAFLEALKALTINSSDPLRLFTSSPETTESASARLDDVIRKFRETGIKSSFPLETETPGYGYNYLQLEVAEQHVARRPPSIDLSCVPLSVLHQWHGIMCSGLCSKEGSLTEQEWRGMTHFRNACLDAIQEHNVIDAQPAQAPRRTRGRHRHGPPKSPRNQSDHRRRSESPSPRSRSPPRIRSPEPRGQIDEGGGKATQSLSVAPYQWAKVWARYPPTNYMEARNVEIWDLRFRELQTRLFETERIRSRAGRALEEEEYRQLLELKVGWEVRSGTLTRQEGEAMLREVLHNEEGLKRVEGMMTGLRLAKRVDKMVI